MEMDVNLGKVSAVELLTISAGSYSNNNGVLLPPAARRPATPQRTAGSSPAHHGAAVATAAAAAAGCCGLLGRLLCASGRSGKTASSSADYNNFTGVTAMTTSPHPPPLPPPASYVAFAASQRRRTQHRRTPQEIYFESRGKSCKKLLKFNGSSNKILLYPEEGWARTASSSYWTITPCWWQPNRCRIEEFAGTQRRQATKAKMVPLEQKGSLLIAGHFHSKKANGSGSCNGTGTGNCINDKDRDGDEFKLYLSSNISMEDYNMGYCLTGFVERRCQQTNTFQMTHFAVIKRQWPSISSDAKST